MFCNTQIYINMYISKDVRRSIVRSNLRTVQYLQTFCTVFNVMNSGGTVMHLQLLDQHSNGTYSIDIQSF